MFFPQLLQVPRVTRKKVFAFVSIDKGQTFLHKCLPGKERIQQPLMTRFYGNLIKLKVGASNNTASYKLQIKFKTLGNKYSEATS